MTTKISLWTIPVLLIGQFALLAVVPVVVVLVSTFRNAGMRAMRWWAVGLAVVYAIPLAIWVLRPDRAQSLSKDIHPAFVALIVAVALAFLVRLYTRRQPAAATGS
jgi:hypothetical protein